MNQVLPPTPAWGALLGGWQRRAVRVVRLLGDSVGPTGYRWGLAMLLVVAAVLRLVALEQAPRP
ncbi:MAG: hypothetical protein MUF10_06040, partial [Thermoanaerobaculaceae bacterium]|nr:hypothetical protein [Thermoanaerobaculaceae bacterium]